MRSINIFTGRGVRFSRQIIYKKTGKVSIPLMITNKMRFQLSMLGYSKEEMKYFTPKKCWEIIDKNLTRKALKGSNRNEN